MATLQRWTVITGAGSGIGAALLRRLAFVARNGVGGGSESTMRLLAIGRSASKLREARRLAVGGGTDRNDCGSGSIDDGDDFDDDGRIRIVSADVGTPEGISAVVSALPSDASVEWIIHNAGTLGPIAPLVELDRSDWRNVAAVNLEAPLFLTQALLPHLKRAAVASVSGGGMQKARVLHVSSGAALGAYEGWGPYCITKAGLNMMYRCFSKELSGYGILVGSVRPGVVDTPMQDGVRAYDGPSKDFPAHRKFLDLKASGNLESSEKVACYLYWLLSSVSDEDFGKEEWDIRLSNRENVIWKEFLRKEME